MIQYVDNIILPYVEITRKNLNNEEAPALVIMDNFKGQITQVINSILEDNHIHVCLLPANTMDLLQPMDISVNKPAKDFLRKKFQQWYSDEVMEQIEAEDDINAEISPIKLSMPVLKEAGLNGSLRWQSILSTTHSL